MVNLHNATHHSESIALLLSRCSVGTKYLAEPGPNDEQLLQIVEAALRAPDHGQLMPFRLSVVRGAARDRLADLFEAYAVKKGKNGEDCAIEKERARRAPLSIAVISRVNPDHSAVPSHEQWACIGGAITNILNAAHMMGFAGKMLSGEKVRDPALIAAFCLPHETLVGWISIGTSARHKSTKNIKPLEKVLSFF